VPDSKAPIIFPFTGHLTKRLSDASVLSRYLGRLKSEQASYAIDSLVNPKERDAFEYGERCGHVAGLVRAEQLLEEALGEEKNDDGE